MSDNIDDYKCPLTLDVFYEPVMAIDGYIYEKTAIIEWFKNNQISPITRKQISNTLIESPFVKNSINKFLEKNPQYMSERFNIPFSSNIKLVCKYINNGDFLNLTGIREFSLKYLMDNDVLLKIFMDCKNNDIIKFLINDFLKYSLISLDYVDKFGASMLHYACKYSNSSIVSYLIDRGSSLSIQTYKTKRTALHYTCKYNSQESIKILIDLSKKQQLDTESSAGWRAIHLLCKFSTIEMIRYIISKGASLLPITTKEGSNLFTIIQSNELLSKDEKAIISNEISQQINGLTNSFDEIDEIFTNQNYENLLSYTSFDLERMITNGSFLKLFNTCDDSIIKHVLENSVDINCNTTLNIKPVHIISKFASPYIINIALKLNIDIEAMSIKGWKPNHYALKYQTLDVIIQMINNCKEFNSITEDGFSIVDMIKANSKLSDDNKNLIALKILDKIHNFGIK